MADFEAPVNRASDLNTWLLTEPEFDATTPASSNGIAKVRHPKPWTSSPYLTSFSEFLRGTAKEDECEPLFKQYKTCITKALKDRGIDTMIEEARADNKENDMEFMKGTRCENLTHRKPVAQSTDTLSVGDP
ncbi:hypothetical protein B0A48_03149 [Cryoendolithus antarcticus]|uniref:Mitochondrial distribution and morphology protein 35 n=1 Tax=Cryoendolithus antarcticus TaxID=1507870 RepID=A0A1V8TMA2_9PEZI|nr:hypothetical protein B0A48_03149 [Cryoendolithus antarcticus]